MIFYIATDENGHRQLRGTQADARAVNKNFEQVDIPTDKGGLRDYIQNLFNQIDNTPAVRGSERPVAVTLEKDGEVTVIARFDTVEDAEDYLATSATIDLDLLDAGMYGVDAPETMVNPPPAAPTYTERSLNLDEEFEKLPLAHQLHFAAVAMENARNNIVTPSICAEGESTTG